MPPALVVSAMEMAAAATATTTAAAAETAWGWCLFKRSNSMGMTSMSFVLGRECPFLPAPFAHWLAPGWRFPLLFPFFLRTVGWPAVIFREPWHLTSRVSLYFFCSTRLGCTVLYDGMVRLFGAGHISGHLFIRTCIGSCLLGHLFIGTSRLAHGRLDGWTWAGAHTHDQRQRSQTRGQY